MDCNLCLAQRSCEKNTYGAAQSELHPAEYAVKENGVLLVVCAEHMASFYGMHETVLIVADTYVPFDDEPS